MSKELYPSNSTIIDLRNKITPAPTSKTKQFLEELQKLTGSSPSNKISSFYPNRTYESERWFTPRTDTDQTNTLIPPRRSMFTPSRLQNMSAQRSRETRKPYWRCPMPTAKPKEMHGSLSSIETILRESSLPSSLIPLEERQSTSAAVIPTTPTIRKAPIKSFMRRREPEPGKKTNVFTIDEDELAAENALTVEDALDKVVPLNIAPKPGFLSTSTEYLHGPITDTVEEEIMNDMVFTFSEPISRKPKCPTPPPPPKPVPKETAIQTETPPAPTSWPSVAIATSMGPTSVHKASQPAATTMSPSIGSNVAIKPTTAIGLNFGTKPETTLSTKSIDLDIGGTLKTAMPLTNGAPAHFGLPTVATTTAPSLTGGFQSGTVPVVTTTTAAMITNGTNGGYTTSVPPVSTTSTATTTATSFTTFSVPGMVNGGVAAPFAFGVSATKETVPSLPNGGYQFGQPASTTTAAMSGVFSYGATTTSAPSVPSNISVAAGGFQFPAPTNAPTNSILQGTGAYQFGAPAVNGNAFQFAEADAPSAGLARSGQPVRKMLQARRMKKR